MSPKVDSTGNSPAVTACTLLPRTYPSRIARRSAANDPGDPSTPTTISPAVMSDSRRYGRPSAGAGLGVEQLLREDGGLADVGAAGGGEQGQRLVLRQLAQVLQRSGPSGIVEFGPIAAAELGEPVRIVGIPAAQGSGWGDLLAPFVQVGLILGQAARPEAVNQHPGAVLGCAVVVDAADSYAGLLLHARASLVRRWDPEDGRGLRLPVRPGAAQAAALVLPDQFGRRRHVIAHADRPGRVLNRVRGASSPPRSSRPASRTPGRPRQPRWPASEPRVPRSLVITEHGEP